MITARWLEKRKPFWDRLEGIVQASGRRGLATLSYREVRELGLLYRQAAADLSTVREDPSSQRLAAYLNQLLARAHNLIYMGRGANSSGIVQFYRREFPRVFRATFSYSLAAFAVFLAGTVAGFLASLADPSFHRFFLGPQMSDTIERRQMWTHSVLTIKPLASSLLMTNNLTVSFTAFALGITGGLGTIYLMLTNGLLLGIVSAACWQAGMGLELASFVAPHGVLELPAVFIAGGGGLLIARGLLFPGSLSRHDALVIYGGRGVRLALGIIPMLVVAGVVEAFISPSSLSVMPKFMFAAGLLGLFVLYTTRAGKDAVMASRELAGNSHLRRSTIP
jgi:uncharacterized membrane protein SpoIIM required for sporulation